MANRTMQAKTLKLRRQLRKLPYRVDDPVGSFTEHSGTPIPARLRTEGVSVPRTPNRELVQGYKHRAASLNKDMREENEKFFRKYGYLASQKPLGKVEIESKTVARAVGRWREDEEREMRKLNCFAASLFKRRG